MIVKFETKSQRVKGICFHSTRPWVITSLHSGEIQLWDYRISTLIAKFEEHEGPVRGIDFHKTQPLFVSGGDDYKIKGWNYKTKRCIWTLKGHLDYIRTVYFHNELPWILSCSDDQTVRIWNYQSRALLSILTGHGHYVMCAQFHPTKDLIVSCSLDQTLRLWDFTQLKKKYTTALGAKTRPNETFSGNDVETRAILEGHDRGINWCAFHPTLNLIVSAADDRKVKLWKYTETKAWEHDSLYGHSNNVCCAVFHEKLDVIISNSEDKTIKVWDLNRRICLDTYKRDTDRYWILAVHPDLHYVAAGSDSGMTLFNLQSERVPTALTNTNDLFYAFKKNLMYREIKSGREIILKAIDHTPTNSSLSYQKPHQIYHNPFNNQAHNILLLFKDKDVVYHKYILYTMEANIDKAKSNITSQFRYCLAAVFVTKDKIAVLKHNNEVEIADMNSGSVKAVTGLPNVDMIHPGPLGKVILRVDDSVMLYDTTSKKIVNSSYSNNEITKLKRIYWNHNYNYVALICKRTIIILNKLFANPIMINEKFSVISSVWSSDNILLYTTNNHLKYMLLNGDTGILRCLESPIYLLQAKDGEVVTIDRDSQIGSISFDREEYLFKLALQQKDSQKLRQIIASHKRLGNSLISYLYRKNYSALALHLVQNTRARFSLALDSGNLEVAYKTSFELKDKDCYVQLGEEALRQGNQQVVEFAYQKAQNYEKLSMLYLLNGNMFKLKKMLQIAQNRGDVMSRFHNALYLGDVHERIRILAEIGLLHLAYLMAVTHNVEDMAIPLRESIADSLPSGDFFSHAKALVPLLPLIPDQTLSPIADLSWPHHQLLEDELVLSQDQPEVQETDTQNVDLDMAMEAAPTKHAEVEDSQPTNPRQDELETDNWGIEDDIEIADQPSTEASTATINFQDQSDGRDRLRERISNSLLAGEHVSCGLFDSAKTLLTKQVGAVNFEPLEPIFKRIYAASSIQLASFPFTNSITHQLLHESGKPVVLGSVDQLKSLLKQSYKLTTEGKFADASKLFRELLYHIPLLVLPNSDDEEDVNALIKIATEYILALRIDAVKRQSASDPIRTLELAAYMGACNLQPVHRILSLRAAMGVAHKLKDYIYGAYFAKKIVQIAEENPTSTKPETVENAKKVYADCERKGSNEHTISFDESLLKESEATPLFCAKSLTLLKGKNKIKCPFCNACYDPKFNGEICEICQFAKIGGLGLGLKIH